MDNENYFILKLKAKSENESFARSAVGAFLVPLSPTIEELSDIKTATSEAVTNAIVHAYEGKQDGEITIYVCAKGKEVGIVVEDDGAGIANIEEARQPFFTTRPHEERSGMGFTVMESFMDSVEVENKHTGGTKVTLKKHLGK